MAEENISNCVFEENNGAISGIGDHGGHVFLNIDSSKFSKNIGSSSLYFLTSVINITNCEFTDEKVNIAVVDGSAYAEASEYDLIDFDGPKTTIENTTFKNNGNIDVVSRVRSFDIKYEVEIKGEVNANIQVWNGSALTVTGILNGNVITDRNTTSDNINVSENGKINGTVTYNPTAYRVSLRYNIGDSEIIDNYDQMIFFLEENKTYTEKEIYMMHFLEKENAKLEYYTDKNFTTLWDYTVTAYTTLYAKWVEHEHVYDQELIVYENAIYEQCECGHLSLALSLSSPTDLVYNGQEKKVIVNNNTDIAETDYSIAYYYQNQEGNWNPVDTYPIASGKYKAELTYNGMTIEQVYEITGKLNNPSTGDHVSMFLIITIISVIVLAIATYFLRKTLENKKK